MKREAEAVEVKGIDLWFAMVVGKKKRGKEDSSVRGQKSSQIE